MERRPLSSPAARFWLAAVALAALAPHTLAADAPIRRRPTAAHHRAPAAPVRFVAEPVYGPYPVEVAPVPVPPAAPAALLPPAPSPLAFAPVLPDPVLAPRRGGCTPGYMAGEDGACRRTGELQVACDPYGGPCMPVLPTPIPYGIGPYLRPNY